MSDKHFIIGERVRVELTRDTARMLRSFGMLEAGVRMVRMTVTADKADAPGYVRLYAHERDGPILPGWYQFPLGVVHKE